MPYRLAKVSSPFWPMPHCPATGDQPGTPAFTKPPKLTLPTALAPVLNPSTRLLSVDLGSKESAATVLLPEPPTALDIALRTGDSVLLSRDEKSSDGIESIPVNSESINWWRVVMGANGLPCLLSGSGAGCMFSFSISSGMPQKFLHLPPCPTMNWGL